MTEILSRAAFEGEIRRRSMRADLTFEDGQYVDPAIHAIWIGFQMAVAMMNELEKEE